MDSLHPNLFGVSEQISSMPIEEANKWKDKGDERLDEGFFEDSIKCFEKALELSPRDIDLWINKGLALSNLGNKKNAINCFNKAIELSPRDNISLDQQRRGS